MSKITHKFQQKIWDEEHKNPKVLVQMDSADISGGVKEFADWIIGKNGDLKLKGIELGCGKGRNVMGLAAMGADITGIDFSPNAIAEAKKRAGKNGLQDKTHFFVHDATKKWPFENESFDLAIDCMATTDIESPKGRKFAVNEMKRVLKSGGYILAYLLSTDDEFHSQMVKKSPASERNAFLHPTTGKFEKTFNRNEISNLYDNLKLIEERRIRKTADFYGEKFKCYHHWMIFKK